MFFFGDFNAKFIKRTTVARDKMFCNFNHECNLFPVNCLPLCSGAKFSYVSYDNKYETLIDVVCVPLEQNRTEILFVKTFTYIHHHTKHLIQLYTRDIQL